MEQEVVGLQPRGLDPLLHGVTGSWRDLELNGPLGLVLHHDSPRGDLVAVADVADLEGHEIAAAKPAMDAPVEERQLVYTVLDLQANPKCPDALSLNGAFWPTILPMFQGSR